MRDDELLNERGVFGHYGLTIPWQRRARRERRGPSFLKLGKMVRYRRRDIEAYLEASRVEPRKPSQRQK
jgi:hypothetical protein